MPQTGNGIGGIFRAVGKSVMPVATNKLGAVGKAAVKKTVAAAGKQLAPEEITQEEKVSSRATRSERWEKSFKAGGGKICGLISRSAESGEQHA